jgi:hypothetical protein
MFYPDIHYPQTAVLCCSLASHEITWQFCYRFCFCFVLVVETQRCFFFFFFAQRKREFDKKLDSFPLFSKRTRHRRISGTYPERGAYCSGWKITDAEMAALKSQHPLPPMCFNAHSKVFGSYGVVYHRSTFRPILDWTATASEPYDHIYPVLIKQERLVRVAYPSLVIQDLAGHVSQIDPTREGQHNFTWRANIHRWEPISRYCDPLTGEKIKHTRK